MNTITSSQLQKVLNNNPGSTLLDVRTPVEFDQAHIEGSINIPLDQLNPVDLFKNNYWPKDHIVYLLCQNGPRAHNASKLFAKENFSGAVIVDGGVSAWIKEGFEVIKGKSRVISLERQVRIAAGSLVLLGVILAKTVHPGFIWLSAIVGAGLINAGITDWCGMGLLLARFPWNKKVA